MAVLPPLTDDFVINGGFAAMTLFSIILTIYLIRTRYQSRTCFVPAEQGLSQARSSPLSRVFRRHARPACALSRMYFGPGY